MECDIDKCPLSKAIDTVDKKADQNAEDIKSLSQTVSNFLISYGKIETLITKIVIPKLEGLDDAVKDLLTKPGKRWDILVTALISGAGMYFITQLIK